MHHPLVTALGAVTGQHTSGERRAADIATAGVDAWNQDGERLMRPADGQLVDLRGVDHALRPALCTSTIGDSALTVMVSSTAPTCMSAFTVAVNDPKSSTFSRLTVENPVNVNVTT